MNLDDEKKHFLVLLMGDFQDAMVTLFKYSSTLMCYTHVCAIFLGLKDQWCFICSE
jgi:hypothetical protein